MVEHRELLGDRIWELTLDLDVLKEDNWTRLVESEMKKFEKEIIHAMKIRGWDGSEDLAKQRWTFPGSLFYSIVLISTIGYGDQTPKTQWGKVTMTSDQALQPQPSHQYYLSACDNYLRPLRHSPFLPLFGSHRTDFVTNVQVSPRDCKIWHLEFVSEISFPI